MNFDRHERFNDSHLASCSRNCEDIALINAIEKLKPPYFQQHLSQQFFQCFCKETCTTKWRLDMRGSTVHEKIERLLENVDIPALIVFLREHQDINHVNLSGNNISDSGFMNLIDYLVVYNHVDELDIHNNYIMESGTKYLLKMGQDLKIKSLNFKANKFGIKASINLANFLLQNEHVLYLNVADVDQSISSLLYFITNLNQALEVCNVTLKCLDISRPNPGWMYNFDSAHFASVIGLMLKHNSTLLALHLQKYNFSCHDIENMMSNAIQNNTLHLLDLGCNNIGDHGVGQLAKWLTKRPALKSLILCRNIITDYGARELYCVIPFSKLLSLDISYNKITDEGMVEILYSLKKSPLLRQLRIFGNSIGHSAAKIVRRMLISQVLNQENIDVRPYKVDDRWYFARYEGDRCKKEYNDVPYGLFWEVPAALEKTPHSKRTFYKYVYDMTKELRVQHSSVTVISNILRRDHLQDCKCCYCFRCAAPHFDEQCRDPNHPDTCNCCKCMGDESSDWSADKGITDRVKSPPDPLTKIQYILKRMSFEIGKNIMRWINIDEDVLEEDLKVITGKVDEDSSKDSCNCSWAQLSMSSLRKYLEETSSKNVLIIPKTSPLLKSLDNQASSSDDCTSTP